ncbi:hypothetical protein DN051_01865 [Streptomyces cadmiisoli]|uniref:Uncharacterized protein n=1 Tax=Streptomyces cadmiisoli TaxID=2184053 RepID=A0A2Z4IS24_9ACTN|nr:hypothetical protein DN051_01865 [Streptomyces cadmiisoli]
MRDGSIRPPDFFWGVFRAVAARQVIGLLSSAVVTSPVIRKSASLSVQRCSGARGTAPASTDPN